LVLSLSPGGLTRSELAKSLRVLDVKLEGKPAGPARLEPLLKPLYSRGWLAHFDISPIAALRLTDVLRNTLLRQLSEQPLWVNRFASGFATHWGDDRAYLDGAKQIAGSDEFAALHAYARGAPAAVVAGR